MDFKTISVNDLHSTLEAKPAPLVDVRTPEEFASGHAVSAVNFPLADFDPAKILAHFSAKTTDTIYLICRSGARSARACEVCLEGGLSNVYNVSGGTLAWVNEGLPIE